MKSSALIEKEKLEHFFPRKMENVLNDGSEYPIFLVILGEKKGSVTMNVSDKQIEVLKELCDDFDLSYRTGKGRVSKPSRTIGSKKEREQRAFFISDEPPHFEILEKGRFYGFSDLSVGEILGFPEESVRFFIENEQPAMKSRKEISRMREEGMFGEELKYLNLVSYIPLPEKEEIEKAIIKGRERKKKLEKFDKEKDLEIGRKMCQKRISRNLYR